MCFTNECDWYAAIEEQSDYVVTTPCRCDECGKMIEVGEKTHHIFQQQHETCHRCEEWDCECPRNEDGDPVCDEKGCQCAEPDYGETYTYDRCESCSKFLDAIEAAEIEEGCHKYEARPNLPMNYDMEGMGSDNAKRYWKKASQMFPELRTSGHLGLLWRRFF